MTDEKIQAKVEALKAQRDQLVQEANSSIAYLNGQIAALEALLVPEDTEETAG